jgi:hypothetical protein
MWAFWFENDKASFKQREEASKQIRLADWTIRKKFKFHYKSLTFEKEVWLLENVVAKKWIFFQFFPILCFDLKLKHFSDSAGLLSAKGKSCPRPKAEKKFFFPKKILRNDFTTTKSHFWMKNTFFTNKMNSRPLTLFRSQIFAEKRRISM